MDIPQEIFKSYDIRGIYPDQINEDSVIAITKAIYQLFVNKLGKNDLTIAIGRDMRLSTPALFKAASETFINLGAKVIDLGIVSTPSFYFAVFKYGYDCGIQITASHNPKDYNGIKIVVNSKNGLIKIGKNTGMDDIKKMSLDGVNPPSSSGGTIIQKTGVLDDEIKTALEISGNPKLDKFKIVADAANALGALFIDAIFKTIPANLIKMNFELDGTFPAHQADPLQASTLVDLQKKVLEQKADLGLAPDGDGDRLFFIDEKGQIIPPSLITALVAKELLKTNKGEKIIADIRYILTPKKIIEEEGGEFILTKVGHAFISQKMEETGAIFAGESSGHYFYRATGNAEAQLPMILIVLKVLTEEKKPFSEIIKNLARSFESGEINFKVANAPSLLEIIKEKFTDGELNTLDGIAISYPTWRFSVRTSNTEPLLRLNVESFDKETVDKKTKEIVSLIEANKL